MDKKLVELAKAAGVPTKDEYFARRLSLRKTENNNSWSESIAESYLKKINFPPFHRVDDNPDYKKEIKRRNRSKTLSNMLTPDFVLGELIVESNDPLDFYIDVNEITEGVWGNFNDASNKFTNGNPVKKMLESMRDSDSYTSDKPYILPVTELDPSLVAGLYKQIKSKSDKYSSKRNGSSRFGLVSVLSQDNFDLSMLQYQKLLISVFDDMIMPFFRVHFSGENIQRVIKLRHEVISISCQKGFVPILAPFEGPWCFWMILGTGPFNGECLCLINSSTIYALGEEHQVLLWLRKMLSEHS